MQYLGLYGATQDCAVHIGLRHKGPFAEHCNEIQRKAGFLKAIESTKH